MTASFLVLTPRNMRKDVGFHLNPFFMRISGLIFLLMLATSSLVNGQTLHTALVDPCGVDINEYVAFTNGTSAVNVADISFHTINLAGGAQPNVTFSWSATGTDAGGDPIGNCPGTNVICLKWLDINLGPEAAIINGLINDLNAAAGPCAPEPNLFVAPMGPNHGSIPAGALFILFLAPGGNVNGTVAPGFNDPAANVNFSNFCGLGPIYAVFGRQLGNNNGTGFMANGNPRSLRIQVGGTTVDSLYYDPTTAIGGQAGIVQATALYTEGNPCTPPMDLFGSMPLDASGVQQLETTVETTLPARLRLYPNPVEDLLTVEMPIAGPLTVQQRFYSIDGKSSETRILTLSEGNHQLLIDVSGLPPAPYVLELRTDLGVQRGTFLKR